MNIENQDKSLLTLDRISVKYNKLLALHDVSFTIKENEILSLIGPNGAGKTTLLNCLSCLVRPNKGDIRYKNISLINKLPHQLAYLGIHRTFQKVSLFHNMSVIDNIKLGLHADSFGGFIKSALRLPSIALEEKRILELSIKTLEQFNLEKYSKKPISELPQFIQKRIELARAIIGKPQLLLLDEPVSGLSHTEITEQKELIFKLRDELNITILIIEHNMNFVMDISDRIVVLNFGQVIAQGIPQDIKNNQDVIIAYLGKGEEDDAISRD